MSKNFIDFNSSILDRCNEKYYDKVLGEYGLSYTQFTLVSKIYENEGTKMNDLAIDGSFDKGSITKAISKLEELGFVSIENSEDDKRTKKLYITQKTRDIMPKLYAIRQEWINYLTSNLNDEEKNIYFELTNKIISKAKEYSSTVLTSNDIKFYGLQKLTLLDYPEHMAATVFTGGCNFRCPFCHNKQLVFLNQGNDEISINYIMNYLNERKKMLDGLCVTGGEPLLHEGLENFLKEVKKLGLKIKLDTNGSNFEKLKRLIDEKLVDYVAMDIKNEKDLYPVTVGVDNLQMDSIEKCVNYLKEEHVDYEFRTTLVKEFHETMNCNKLGEWIKGCKNYYLQNFEDHGSCIQEGLHALNESEILKIRDEIKPYVKNITIRGLDEEGK